MLDPIERENEIMDTLRELAAQGLVFVLVGGYGISAYRHRFSADADMVVKEEDVPGFDRVLQARGFRKSMEKRLDNEYASAYARYEKTKPKAFIDLLIGAVGVRQTAASFGYDLVLRNSSVRAVEGSEKSATVRVADKEILIAMKLHAGRLTDMRDIAALAFRLDLARIRSFLYRGDITMLKKNMAQLGILIDRQDFRDSFKGVFMEKHYRIDPGEIRKLAGLSRDSDG